jgi:hypothetical protein
MDKTPEIALYLYWLSIVHRFVTSPNGAQVLAQYETAMREEIDRRIFDQGLDHIT